MAQPRKRINTEHDLQLFLKSSQFASLWAFILRLNGAVTTKKVSAVSESSSSAGVQAMLAMLDRLHTMAEEVPCEPAEQGRFGNRAFRTWHARLTQEALGLLTPVVSARGQYASSTNWPMTKSAVLSEVTAYLAASFGDPGRIDYGSGHEAMFAVLLYCLRLTGVFDDTDDAALVLLVFRRYLRVTRLLQIKFRLEPAGSRGVWGLDDYSFLPFLWGSAQLLAQNRIEPGVVDDDDAIAEHADEYLYVEAIAFIKGVKTGAFFEHSPMLFDISRVAAGWPKINQGMIRMYRGEVWEKRVVVQHMLFGDIFRFQDGTTDSCTVGSASAKVTSTP